MLLLFVVVASAAATATTIVATNLAAVVAAAAAVADAIATTTIKRAQHYFPALVNWSVVENNVSGFRALCSEASPRDVPVHLAGGPRAPLTARARKCWPPFRGGLPPPHGEKKAGEKHLGAPARPL